MRDTPEWAIPSRSSEASERLRRVEPKRQPTRDTSILGSAEWRLVPGWRALLPTSF